MAPATPTVAVMSKAQRAASVSVLLSKLASMGDTRANAVTMMVCVLEPKPGDTEASSLVSHNGIALARQRAAKKGVIEGSSLARGFAIGAQ